MIYCSGTSTKRRLFMSLTVKCENCHLHSFSLGQDYSSSKMRDCKMFWLFTCALAQQCNDLQLGSECIDYCSSLHGECSQACDQNDLCLVDCGRAMNNCLNYCPCQVGCPTRCDDCVSSFCKSVQYRDMETNKDYIACQARIV